MKSLLFAIAIGVCTLISPPVFSEDKPADTTPFLLEKLRADKKLLIADNLPLLEQESIEFWPIVDAYEADLAIIDARITKVILEYWEADNNCTLDDAVAWTLSEDMLTAEGDEAKLRHHYFFKLLQVLSPTKVARYQQIEGKIRAAKRYEMTSLIPLIEERAPMHSPSSFSADI